MGEREGDERREGGGRGEGEQLPCTILRHLKRKARLAGILKFGEFHPISLQGQA